MKKLLFALAALAALFSSPADATQTQTLALIVSSCGTLPSGLTYAAGRYGVVTMDTTGKLCDSATGGGGGGGTSATFGAAFPTTGTPAGGTDGTNFQPLVVDPTTHYLQVDVKAGGAGGGAVFGPTAVGTAAANPPVVTGGTADGTGTGAVSVWKIVSGIGYLNNAQVNGVNILTGAGATGTGAQRVTVAQDTTTIAGSAPGTAGTPSANVVSVQGVASGTVVPISGTVQPGNTPNTTAWLMTLSQGGSALSATNGLYTNLLQGNAVISASNPLPGNMAQMGGTAINSGCVAALSGFSTTIPSTVCGIFGAYVLNSTPLGAAAASASNPVTPSNQPVGSATFTPGQVSVGSTATVIAAARTGVSGTGRVSLTITNTTTTAIYIGGSGVTTSTGALLPGIVGASKTINTTAAIYGIVATGTATVTEDETY